MLDQEEEQVLPSIQDSTQNAQYELTEDIVLLMRSRTTTQVQHNLQQIGLKGQLTNKAKWYTQEKAEENFPPLFQQYLLGTKSLQRWGSVMYIASLCYFLSTLMLLEWKKWRNQCTRPFYQQSQFGKFCVKNFRIHFEVLNEHILWSQPSYGPTFHNIHVDTFPTTQESPQSKFV